MDKKKLNVQGSHRLLLEAYISSWLHTLYRDFVRCDNFKKLVIPLPFTFVLKLGSYLSCWTTPTKLESDGLSGMD